MSSIPFDGSYKTSSAYLNKQVPTIPALTKAVVYPTGANELDVWFPLPTKKIELNLYAPKYDLQALRHLYGVFRRDAGVFQSLWHICMTVFHPYINLASHRAGSQIFSVAPWYYISEDCVFMHGGVPKTKAVGCVPSSVALFKDLEASFCGLAITSILMTSRHRGVDIFLKKVGFTPTQQQQKGSLRYFFKVL